MNPYDETPYTPGKTLRETISPVLVGLGYGWDDVSGISLAVERNGVGDATLGDYIGGASLLRVVPPGSIPSVLDVVGQWAWGAAPEDYGAIHHSFDATLWLPRHVVRFSPRYRTGDYVGCDVTPIATPEAYMVDLSPSPAPKR